MYMDLETLVLSSAYSDTVNKILNDNECVIVV